MTNNRGRNVTSFSPFNFGYQPMYFYDDFKSLGAYRVSTETWHQQLSNTTPCTQEIEKFRRCRKYAEACSNIEDHTMKINIDAGIEIKHQEGWSKGPLKQVLHPIRCKTAPNVTCYADEVIWPPKKSLGSSSCEILRETSDDESVRCYFPQFWKFKLPLDVDENKPTSWISKMFKVCKKKAKSANASNSKSAI